MTPAQANQIAEYYHKLWLISGRDVADRVHREAMAAGHDAERWAQSMPNVLNSWAWWDGVSGRFEQALTEALAGRDPLGEKPVHHRWHLPMTAAEARVIDEYWAIHGGAVYQMLHWPQTPALTFEEVKKALAAVSRRA